MSLCLQMGPRRRDRSAEPTLKPLRETPPMDARSPSHVVTLVASHDAADAIPDIAAALSAEIVAAEGPDWLAPALACDICFDSDPTTAEMRARRVIGDMPIDVLIQPVAG